MPRFAAMTRLALASLLAVTGCNWIFGLEPTIPLDAGPPAEVLPPGPRTRLVWAIATSDGMPAAPGVDPQIVLAPIGSETTRPEVPVILVGDDTGLAPAPYDISDGSFEIPYPLRESPHRIVYTLPNDSVPHEVQWSVTGATLVVPRTTRLDAPRPPDGSGYTITPTGLGVNLSSPSLYTSGVVTGTNDSNDFEQTSGAITFRYPLKGKPLAGPLGAPQIAHGDWVLIGEWVPRSQEQSSLDGWALAKVDLAANTMSQPVPEPAWQTTEVTLTSLSCTTNCLPGLNTTQTQQRLTNVLGALGSTSVVRMAYGVSPSTELQGFLPGVTPTFVESPLMLPFAESTQNDSSITLADPSASLAYKRVVFSRVGKVRTVDNVALTSSINTITDVLSGSMPYPAPLATNIKLGDQLLTANEADGVGVPASSGMVRLKFEQEAGYIADDFVVTLYQLTASGLAPVRVYHVVQPEVKVDGSLLASGNTYVFGITARTGFGGVDRGDYAKATYPFGSTTTFPRTFRVQ